MAYSDQDFENELREKLGNDAPLPPGLEWEAMRHGVKKKIAAKHKTKRPLLFWWWPGVCLALLLLTGLIGYQKKKISPSSTPQLPQAEKPAGKQEKHKDNDQVDFRDVATENTGSTQATPPSVNDMVAQTNLPPTAVSLNHSPLKSDPDQYQGRYPAVTKNEFRTPPSFPTPPVNITTSTIDASPQMPTNAFPKIDALAMLPFLSYSFRAEGDFLPHPKVTVETINTPLEPKGKDDLPSKGWFIDVLVGTQLASSTYRGNSPEYAALRSQTEAALPGHHFAVGVGKNLGKKWQLRTSLAYNRVRTLTDYQGMRTFTSTFQNVPLRINVRGDTIFGPADLEVRESQELKSYQREQRLAVPLLLGRNFLLGGSRLALRAGPEFGLLIGSGGKVLTADAGVRPISNTDFQRLSISARLEGELVMPLGAKGPLLIGRVGFRQMFGGGQLEIRRRGNSVVGGIGVRLPFRNANKINPDF